MLFTTKLHPATRGQLLLAAIPLATIVITRALAQLEELIEQRVAHLTGLDARIAAREAALGVLVKYAPDPGSSTIQPDPEATYATTPAGQAVTLCIAPGCTTEVVPGAAGAAAWYCDEHTPVHIGIVDLREPAE